MQPRDRKLYLKTGLVQRIRLFFMNIFAIISLFITTLFDHRDSHNPHNRS